MTSRRSVLKSVPLLVAAVAGIPTLANTNQRCEVLLMELAAAMKEIHGGEWIMNIDHEAKMASTVQCV